MNNKVERAPLRPIFPTPAGMVVSVDKEGKPNIITLGEIFNLASEIPCGLASPSGKPPILMTSLRSKENLP